MSKVDRAREYSQTKDRLSLLSTAISLLGGSGLVFSGLARRMNDHLLPASGASILQRGRYVAVIGALSTIISLPLRYYSSYVVEKLYELSNQSPAEWLADQAKMTALSMPLEIGLLEGLYAALRRWPRSWWLVVSGATIPLTAGLSQLYPVLIAPRFNRYEPLADEELAERLRDLTDRAGVPVADVMQMDMSRRTSKANAFFAGLGPTRRIVLADTMLETFTPEEIEGVVAHEAAHQIHRDIWRLIGMAVLTTLATAASVHVVAGRLVRAIPSLTGTSDLANPRSLPVLSVVASVVGVLLSPWQLAQSRRMERRADRFAIRLTGNPRAYAGAMRKLSEQNLADPSPSPAITFLLHSHPPLSERIAAAEAAEFNLVEGLGVS